MSFIEKLKQKSKETNSIICMGIDPILERIPIKEDDVEKKITKFYLDILSEMVSRKVFPAMVKPNYAFFGQYGFPGLKALKKIIDEYKKQDILVLFDGKRNDIGKTAKAYAKEVFEFWEADAITINAYLGKDGVQPFLEYCEKGKGVYVLVRTSNKGAGDLQDLNNNGKKIFMRVAEKLIKWYVPGIGAVIGATYPDELKQISELFVKSEKKIPLLIPGVGSQGGSLHKVITALKDSNNDIFLHRINSSSGINYAYEKTNTKDYAKAAVDEIQKLNREISKFNK